MVKVKILIGMKYNAQAVDGKSGGAVNYIFPKLHDTKMGILFQIKHDIDHVGVVECSSSLHHCCLKYDVCQILVK